MRDRPPFEVLVGDGCPALEAMFRLQRAGAVNRPTNSIHKGHEGDPS
jgi:hypothetical protein